MNIEEVILQTASLPRTKLFYHKTLELPIVAKSEKSISFTVGKSKLTFEHTSHEKPYYHIAFNITNNRFSDSFEWIDRKLDILPVTDGMPIASYPNWNAESFYFYDNNGSILEFIARFDLPYQSTQPFSISDIIEISEVGIVTNNVAGTCEQITTDHKIPYFSKGPKPSHDFAAMGNDNGLFIISAAGRTWVPTHKAAKKFPLSVIADGQAITFSS